MRGLAYMCGALVMLVIALLWHEWGPSSQQAPAAQPAVHTAVDARQRATSSPVVRPELPAAVPARPGELMAAIPVASASRMASQPFEIAQREALHHWRMEYMPKLMECLPPPGPDAQGRHVALSFSLIQGKALPGRKSFVLTSASVLEPDHQLSPEISACLHSSLVGTVLEVDRGLAALPDEPQQFIEHELLPLP